MDEGKQLKKLLFFICMPLLVFALAAAVFLFIVNKASPDGMLRSRFDSKTWMEFRLGEELHFDVENKTDRSFMMIAMCGTKSHIFTVTPSSHAIYTPLFRIPSSKVEVEKVYLHFIDEHSILLQDPVELFIPLTAADGSLFPYCAYGDLTCEAMLMEAADGAFMAAYIAD